MENNAQTQKSEAVLGNETVFYDNGWTAGVNRSREKPIEKELAIAISNINWKRPLGLEPFTLTEERQLIAEFTRGWNDAIKATEPENEHDETILAMRKAYDYNPVTEAIKEMWQTLNAEQCALVNDIKAVTNTPVKTPTCVIARDFKHHNLLTLANEKRNTMNQLLAIVVENKQPTRPVPLYMAEMPILDINQKLD